MTRSHRRPLVRHAVRWLAAALLAGSTVAGAQPAAAERADPTHFLIADQFNNRVIEVDRAGHVLWHFGIGPHDFTPRSIVGVNDAERVGSLTLMAGTGIPPNTVASCANPAGCPDNRVILVDREGHIVWQYGTFGPGGSGPGRLNTPVQATYLPGGVILITDQANERVIAVDRQKRIVWQYGHTGVAGSADGFLNNPNSAEVLENGHVLIADENNNRAIEVDPERHHVLRVFTAGGTTSGVAFASRLENGHTLITDSNNNRVVEVDAADHVVWQYVTNTAPGSNPNPLPTRAVRLRDGTTLISDQFNDRVIDVDREGEIVWSMGDLNQPGIGHGLLNGPYDAKAIGDFTGLTDPFEDG